MDQLFCGSEIWNNNLTWQTEDHDFTLCFQRTVLVWTPCLFLWMFSWLNVVYIKRSMDRNIPWGILNVSKLVLTGALILLVTIDLGKAILHNSETMLQVDYYTALIKILSFTLSGSFVYFNKKNGLRTSGVLFFFWFFLFLFSIPQCRSEIRRRIARQQDGPNDFWNEYNFFSFMIFFTITTIVFILNCFVDHEPLVTKYPTPKNPCPEVGSNYASKLMFSWFDNMAWKGYKAPLRQKSLWDLKPEDRTTEIIPTFTKHWDKAVNDSEMKRNMKKFAKNRKISILPILWQTFNGKLLFAWLLKLGFDAIAFVTPKLLGLTIDFVDSSNEDGRPENWKGMMYAALLFIAASLETLIFNHYIHRIFTIGCRIRTALISAIYRKSLVVSNETRKESTIGEITNLISNDAEKFTEILLSLNMVWSAPFQISISMYYLWTMLGPAVLAGLAVMLISMPITALFLNKMRKYHAEQMADKDERIEMMNEVLNGIKILKFYAWEMSFQNLISSIRGREVKTLTKAAYFQSFVNLIWSIVPFLVCLCTFGLFVLIDEQNVLTPKIVFVALNLFNIIRFPLAMLPELVSNLIQTRVAIHRINKFLNSKELDAESVTHINREGSALLIENGTFAWDNQNEILSSINMRVEKGQLVAVVGNIGSGKSSLLSAFLGEMNKISGTVNTAGGIAYVSQQTWIQNCTLRDNILFGKPFEEERYRRVIAACALTPDLDQLPAGDQTEIGEKGINLSGGQKQRISLARAVYHDADIYVLDDPLSAVDAHVSQHIFEEVIGPTGLLASNTRIVVTHALNYLPKVDNIFVLKKGKISESGDYSTLLNKRGAFAEFLLQHMQDSTDSDDEENEFFKQENGNLLEMDDKLIRRLDRCISKISQKSCAMETSQKVILSESPSEIKDKLIADEELCVGSVKLEVFKHYVKSMGVKWIVLMLAANVVFQSFSIGSNVWLTKWSTDAGTDIQRRDTYYLGVYAAFGVLITVSGLLLDLAPRLGGLVAGGRLHLALLNGILRAPLSFFETTPTGRILSRFSGDIDGIDKTLPEMLSTAVGLSFEVLATIVVISFSTYLFVVVVIPIGLLYYFVQQIYIATSRQLKRLASVSRSPIYSHFGETLQGAHTVRAFSVQERFIKESDKKVNTHQTAQFANIVAGRWLAIRLEMVGNLVILFATLFAVLNRDTISSAIAGLSITSALLVTKRLNRLVRTISFLETEAISVERVKGYSEIRSEAVWNSPSQTLAKNWPEVGTVEFNNFQLRYREGLELSLKGLSFKVNGGEKVGIIGRTGAGKSSLTLALFRIIESAGGSIVIDGQDISELGLHDLRSRLTIIPQDPVLFSGTLRLNLDPFEQNSDDELWTAVEHSHLKSFVETLPAGLDHNITEGGDNLSVGQRQLVCFARALLRKTKVLVLDEATAAIDLETDDLIQKTIQTEFNDCTILTIAHRLNTIRNSDRVIVLDQGEIAEFASPEELLQNKTSLFYSMARDAGLV